MDLYTAIYNNVDDLATVNRLPTTGDDNSPETQTRDDLMNRLKIQFNDLNKLEAE